MSESLLKVFPKHVLDSEGRGVDGVWRTLREEIIRRDVAQALREQRTPAEKLYDKEKTRALMREMRKIGRQFKRLSAA